MNPMDILKNAGEIQRRMGEMKEKMERIQVVGSSGGGMVKIAMNGKMEILSVEIAREVVDPEDIPMLQDLVRAAMNDVQSRMKETMAAEMGGLAGLTGMSGAGFPGL